MKSAYELAMERMGGSDDKPLDDKQKEKIAEIEASTKPRLPNGKSSLKKAWKMPLQKAIRQAEEARKILAQEISSIEEKAESEKDKIRNS